MFIPVTLTVLLVAIFSLLAHQTTLCLATCTYQARHGALCKTCTKISLGNTTAESRRYTSQSKQERREFRIFNEANGTIFRQLINDDTWTEITDDMDAQESYSYTKIDEIYMKHYIAIVE